MLNRCYIGRLEPDFEIRLAVELVLVQSLAHETQSIFKE
jgi:hypothetical protein